ncbi:flagellar motor protein MotB [Spirosoma pollinicola]|uniref:Flagellar motor protein MotB n=1 Tax=Spirosoma pollinicola TaxID=2057025 RepID=A0A2K8ZBL8_9BACT|nr:flagellar motor protein MotB [Spirosoma pollinicola]
MTLHSGKVLLILMACFLLVGSGHVRSQVIDYSRLKASGGRYKPTIATARPADSVRKNKPSLLTIKVFSVDISKPLASAVAVMTSRITNRTERIAITNGQLTRVFERPDNLSIEVNADGYKSAQRTMTIAVSPTGNRYEFDAQLDPAPISLTVWAVDSRTNKPIHDAHFTVSGKAGNTTLLLTPDSTTGVVKTELPGKGMYQLTSSASGYGDFTKSIKLDSMQSEARVILTRKKTPDVTKAQALPEAVVKSAKSTFVETPVAKPIIKAPTLSGSIQMPAVTNKPFGSVENGKPVQLKNVYFDQSLPILRSESFPELDQLVSMLAENPAMQIELRGHTDNQGDFDLNVKLSRDRCQAVIDYLVTKGIAKNRLSALGRGPIDPIAPNNNEENRRKNRRVEFIILYY